MKKFLLLCLLTFVHLSYAEYAEELEDVSVKHEKLGGICFTTIDIEVSDNLLKRKELILELDHYSNIREDGFLIDMFYSNAGLGKSQWTEMDTRGIYVMSPGSLYLPISNWAETGLQPSWKLRISMMSPSTRNTCK